MIHRLVAASVLLPVLLTGCGSIYRFPEQGGEMLLNKGRDGLLVAQAENLPPDVRDDLERLSAALMRLPVPWDDQHLYPSPTGRSIAVGQGSSWNIAPSVYSAEKQPTGVWFWPDWRDAETFFHLPQFTVPEFVGEEHLFVSHWVERGLIDMRDPERLLGHRSFGFIKDRQIAPNGLWAVVTEGGELRVGSLGDGGLLDSGKVVPSVDNAQRATFVHGGRFLVVSDATSTFLFDPNTFENLTEQPKYRFVRRAGPDAFTAHGSGRTWHVQVSETGDFDERAMQLNPISGQRPAQVSPSGRFMTTWEDTIFGGVRRKMTRSPHARRDPMPPMMSNGWHAVVGWLAW